MVSLTQSGNGQAKQFLSQIGMVGLPAARLPPSLCQTAEIFFLALRAAKLGPVPVRRRDEFPAADDAGGLIRGLFVDGCVAARAKDDDLRRLAVVRVVSLQNLADRATAFTLCDAPHGPLSGFPNGSLLFFAVMFLPPPAQILGLSGPL